MPDIVTLTFSPCIDKSTSVPSLLPERKLKCAPPKLEPGGGGINVARAIRKLGGDALAIFPSGGYTGKHFNHLLEIEKVSTLIVETAKETRENIIVFDEASRQQYRFGMPCNELSESEWLDCLQRLDRLTDLKYLVVSGSLPEIYPNDIFARLAEVAKQKFARLIVDTPGAALKEAAKAGVYLIKPNLGELGTLSGRVITDIEDAKIAARELIQNGACGNIVVSLGKSGALMATSHAALLVRPPAVEVKSTVGAGDSMVAGIVYCLVQNKGLDEALRFGVAAGTAATLRPGTELCDKDDTDKLFAMINEMEPRNFS